MIALVVDILVLCGVAGATVGVVGIARSRSGYMQIHAATLCAVAGALPILGAGLATGDGAIAARSILVGAVLLMTTPVSGHAVARLQYHLDRGGGGPGAGRPPAQSRGGSHTNEASRG